jgi:hypothetical protein
MGLLIGTGVHRRVGSVCRAVTVVTDNPPDYTEIDGSECTISLGLVVDTVVTNVARDTIGEETGMATGTNNTWHYPGECPDR